jgi:hypothetical protein
MAIKKNGAFGMVPEITVGVSDAVLLIVSVIGFVFLAITLYSMVILRLKSRHEMEEDEKDLNYEEKLATADVSTLNRAQRRARARHIMKQQRRITPAAPTVGEDGEPIQENQDLDDEPMQAMDPSLQHSSRKERQKAAKMAEKAERHLFEEERRRQQEEAQKAAKREKKERERMQSERSEEERQARQEQREADELAAYKRWKTFLASPDGTKSLSVNEWVKELEKIRAVSVDSLAKRFQISREAVVSRIQELQASSRITGVLEADGRFIYVSQVEMSTIASCLRRLDKASVQQIAKETHHIINQ